MKILIIGLDSSGCQIIEKEITEINENIEVEFSNNIRTTTNIVEKYSFDIIIVDLEIFSENLILLESIAKGVKVIILEDSDEITVREKLISIELNLVDYIIKSDINFMSYLIKVISRLFRNDFIKLLFVGNDIILGDRIEKILNVQNYHCSGVKTHIDAMQKIKEKRIDLILCDYDILEEEGVFFIESIREKYTMQQLPIVIMSNFNKDINIEKYLKAGVNDYIHKPFSQEGLLCRLNLNIENKLLTKKNTECFLKDNFTNLYSFEFFSESGKKMLNGAKREETPLAIGIIEIDNFYNIVDRIGYKSNEIIRHLSGIILASLRTTDLVAKYTGEKIIILMTNAPLKNAFQVIDRIRKNIKVMPYVLESGGEISYTISGGIAGRGDGDLNTMIDQADEYLYRAKKYGMDRIEVLIENEK